MGASRRPSPLQLLWPLVPLVLSLLVKAEDQFREKLLESAADMQADESRRLYAISIPTIFSNPPQNRFNNPLYSDTPHGTNSFNLHPAGAQFPPPPPPPPHRSPSSSPHTPRENKPWNGGLRLIVSGPVEDHSAGPPKEDFYEYEAPPKYYNPYERTRPNEAPKKYYSESFYKPQESSGPQQDSFPRSHHSQGSYFPANPQYEDLEFLSGAEFPTDKEEGGSSRQQDSAPPVDYYEQDYHDQGDYYADEVHTSRFEEETPKKESVERFEYPKEEPPVTSTEKVVTTSSKTRHEVPYHDKDSKDADYYDALYHEFMEETYDEYYDSPVDYNYEDTLSQEQQETKPIKDQVPETSKASEAKDTPVTDVKVTTKAPEKLFYSTHIFDLLSKNIGESSERRSKIPTSTEKMEPSAPVSSTPPEPSSPPPTTTEKLSTSTTTEAILSSTSSTLLPPQDHPYKKSGTSVISLSEILQGIGISLPQFLVQLKMHNYDLKTFTLKLQMKQFSKSEFKRVNGDIGKLIKLLEESPSDATEEPSTTSSAPKTTTRPSYKSKFIPKSHKSSTTEEPTTTTKKPKTTTTEATTSTPAMSTTTKKPAKPKTFGFKPSVSVKNTGIDMVSPNISVAKSIEETTKSEESPVSEEIIEFETFDDSSEIPAGRKNFRPRESWRDRMQYNRNIMSSRTGGSTTVRPKARPNYGYYGGDSQFPAFTNEREGTSSEDDKNSDSNGSLDQEESRRDVHGRISSIIGLTEGTPRGGDYNHPRYDNDPHSLNIATRSAIMAASVLGGIALAVFATILAFVMYKNHAGRKRIRIPLPLSGSSDGSTSSTPPLYSKRPRYGVTVNRSNKQSDFWGTLRKKFDPYSLTNSSSSASYY